ncbi:MAG: helix-hairpin-helix domain-containing protein [Thermoguttaceae bacterium]|nr:helix-hairpin-helix domain-containing protein [Thermoguttaceae bacterium]MDW8078033.1 DNA-directed RNA polymerase subunit alpha C-terminal domain-containing protein [Thermoguttaceae bacterium]
MSKTRIPINPAYARHQEMRAKLELSTAEIGLAVRTTNCLEEKGIFTVEDLLNCTPEFLLSIPNFGEKTLEEVYRCLERLGFYHKSRRQGGEKGKNRSFRASFETKSCERDDLEKETTESAGTADGD